MALSLNNIQPTGNITKVNVDAGFLSEFIALMSMASVHIVGSAECDHGLIVKVQGEIIPSSEFCFVEIGRMIVDANGVHPGATASIAFRPRG